jgi:hypothetical protein
MVGLEENLPTPSNGCESSGNQLQGRIFALELQMRFGKVGESPGT